MRKLKLTLATTSLCLCLTSGASAKTVSGIATSYSPCDGSTTATSSGKKTRVGYIANNQLKLGSWVEMIKPRMIMNRRWFKVMDRGGPGFVMDIWTPSCSWMNNFGVKRVAFRTMPSSELYRGKPAAGWQAKASGTRMVWRPR